MRVAHAAAFGAALAILAVAAGAAILVQGLKEARLKEHLAAHDKEKLPPADTHAYEMVMAGRARSNILTNIADQDRKMDRMLWFQIGAWVLGAGIYGGVLVLLLLP